MSNTLPVSAQAAGELCALDTGLLAAGNTFARRATLAQTFVPTQSGSLVKITHGLQSASGVANYDLLITTATGNLPSWTGGSYNVGSVLYQATGQTSFATSAMVNGIVNIPTGSQPYLTAGTKYALILIPGTPTNGDMMWRGNSSASSYASGSAFELNGTTWSLPGLGPKDHGFKMEGLCGPPPPAAYKWCCPGTNLVVNGDFQSGNTGFTSGHAFNPLTSLYATVPGQYNVVTSPQALAISPNWQVTDHAVCNGLPGSRFMVVNGKTTQPTGSSRVIWQQTVPVVKDREYRFCANLKNLVQSTFDIKPRIRVQFTNPSSTIGPITVNEPTGPCNWNLISANIVPTASTVTIRIILDEAGLGDGNDLALDDISLQAKTQVSPNLVSVNYATTDIGGGHFNVSATPVALPPGYTYFWMVCEYDVASNQCLGTNIIINPPTWQTSPASNTFQGYNGQNWPLSGTAPGTFVNGKVYRIFYVVWSDCEAYRVSTMLLQYTKSMTKPQLTPLKLSAQDLKHLKSYLPKSAQSDGEIQEEPEAKADVNKADVKKPTEKQADKKQPNSIKDNLKEKLKPRERAEPAAKPSEKEAAQLPRAEDDAASVIALAKPSVEVGQEAPNFAVKDSSGKAWRLSDLRGKKNVLLTFFPKCFTGGCANHLSSLRDRQAEFDEADTQVIAISVDPADGEKGQIAFAKQWQLTFPLIPDTDRSLSMLYGAANNNKQLAARMSVFIDKDGIVRLVDTNVKVASHGGDVVARIREFTG